MSDYKSIRFGNNQIMNFTDFSNQIAEFVGITKGLAKEILRAEVDLIVDNLLHGKSMSINAFGRLECVEIAGYTGRSISGDTITVPPRRAIRFRPSNRLRGVIKYNDPDVKYNQSTKKYYHDDGSPVVVKEALFDQTEEARRKPVTKKKREGEE